MKRNKMQFVFENGLQYDNFSKSIKQMLPRRPITAYSRKNKEYVLIINLIEE